MAKSANLVQEETTTTGTGDITLSNKDGRQSFNAAFGTGGTDLFFYFIMHQSAAEWEVGTGHLSASTTLVRDTVLNSSNSNAAVNFSAGTKDVTSAYPYDKLPTVHIGDTAPTNPETGDLWFDSTDGTLNLYYTDATPDSFWVNITAGQGGYSILDEDNMVSDSATAVPTQQSVKAYVDAEVSAQLIQQSAETATTSGTAVDFTDIPAGVKRITVKLDSVSTNGTSNMLIQVGTGGTFTTSGYVSTASYTSGGEAVSDHQSTAGITWPNGTASHEWYGMIVLEKMSTSDDVWVATGILGTTFNGATTQIASVFTEADLDCVRLTSVTPNTFDGGSVAISWEF